MTHRPRGLAAPLALAAFAFGLPAGTASAASLEPTVLQPFEQRTESSGPSTPVAVGSTAFFVADDGVHGAELHKTDGSTGGTSLVKDLRVGPDGASIDRYSMTAFAGSVYFIASAAPNERALWKSDGTAAGTTLVRTLGESEGSNAPMAVAGSKLFFGALDGANGFEPWVTDGTAAGTRLVKDIAGGGSSDPFAFARLGTTNKVVFYANDGTHGHEPWVSDGTEAGTTLLKDVLPGSPGSFQGSSPNTTSVGTGKVAFMANNRELWASDGTDAGTVRLTQLADNPHGGLVAAGERLVLSVYRWQDGVHVPYVSDLTPAGTQALDLATVSPGAFASDGTTVWFAADSPATGPELFRTDGTVAGTTPVEGVPDAAGAQDYDVAPLGVAGGRVFLRYKDTTHGSELWSVPTSGGTPALVRDVLPGRDAPQLPSRGSALGSTLLLPIDDDATGTELWRTDGTAAGTSPLADLNRDATDQTKPFGVAIGDGRAFYLTDTRDKRALYVTDGTPGGSRLVKAVAHDSGDDIGKPALIGDVAYFPVATQSGTVTLWRSDGTEAGTTPLRTLSGGSASWSPFASGDAIYFGTSDQQNTRGGPPPATALWRTDGTAAGTVTLDTPGLLDVQPLGMLGSTLLLQGRASDIGRELYAIDGPDAQPRLVRDIEPGPSSSNPYGLVNAGGKAYFVAYTDASGSELWATDGTTGGTRQVADTVAGGGGAEPRELTPVGDKVLFTAAAADESDRLTYVSDGTEQGTKPVSADKLKSGDSPYDLTALGGKVVYRGDGVKNDELFVTDGTESGTLSLGEIDDYYGDPDMQAVDGRVYFRHTDVEHGRELWSTDGTPGGMRLEADLLAGGASSNPSLFGELRGGLLLSPYDFTIGRSMVRYGTPIMDEQPEPPKQDPPPSPVVATPQAVPTAPAAAPKPAVRLVVPRPAPTSVKLTRTKVQRDSKLPYRFVFTGKLGVPKGVSRKAACKGEVVATAKRGDRTVESDDGKVAKDCTYKVVLKITTLKGLSRNGGKLEVKLRFTGNAVLRPMNAGTASVRYGD